MNLLLDRWIEVERRSGQHERIAPVQLTANSDDPVVEILAPRADFRGALYQFLIGLLQTVYAPSDLSEWKTRWTSPPDVAELQRAFAPYTSSFELDSTGPAFMQDFDLLINTDPRIISRLLIDGASENAIEKNMDHFRHRGDVNGICLPCASTALISAQLNAPGEAASFFASVRKGGPLTTLLVPHDSQSKLWHKLWLNVLPQSSLLYPVLQAVEDIFPWMAATRTSDPRKSGVVTTPDEVHPLQVYWSMSSRIRLNFVDTSIGVCELCGAKDERLIHQYRTIKHGVNYDGAWKHPLTPYKYDQDGKPLPFNGHKSGGIGYRHWLGLTIGKKDKEPEAALVVHEFNRFVKRLPVDAQKARLWCFGYDMKKANALCWYDCTVPLHIVTPELQRHLIGAVEQLLDVASEAAESLHEYVMDAWFKDLKNGKLRKLPHDAAKQLGFRIELGFWQSSEAKFYELLERIVNADLENVAALVPFYREWLIYVSHLSLEQFDDWALAAPIEEMKMERVVKARADLAKWLNQGKVAKELWKQVKEIREEQA